MVFFHGGGNIFGSTQDPPFDSPPLATQGVVVVTAEYRLGALGFFAHPALAAENNGSAGNYALMDMIAALSWVQQNIAAFGGDPANVTAFGQSDGAFDLQVLLVSPPAQGLFSRMALESNAIIAAGLIPTLAAAEATDAPFVQLVGCANAADVLSCLRALPAETLVNNQDHIFEAMNLEPQVVPVDPFTALQQHGSPVPLLWGSNREEADFINVDITMPIDPTQYTTDVRNEFDPFGVGVADQVLALYPVANYDAPIWAWVDVNSDFIITCDVRAAALAAVGPQRPTVWRYFFTHRLENPNIFAQYRAFHTEELYFVFGNLMNINGAAYTPTMAEVTLSNNLMGYWTRFAATGNPNGAGAAQWLPYDAANEQILQLDDTFSTLNGYHITQCNYLQSLYP